MKITDFDEDVRLHIVQQLLDGKMRLLNPAQLTQGCALPLVHGGLKKLAPEEVEDIAVVLGLTASARSDPSDPTRVIYLEIQMVGKEDWLAIEPMWRKAAAAMAAAREAALAEGVKSE